MCYPDAAASGAFLHLSLMQSLQRCEILVVYLCVSRFMHHCEGPNLDQLVMS